MSHGYIKKCVPSTYEFLRKIVAGLSFRLGVTSKLRDISYCFSLGFYFGIFVVFQVVLCVFIPNRTSILFYYYVLIFKQWTQSVILAYIYYVG